MQTNQPSQIAARKKFRVNNAMIAIAVLMVVAGANRWQHTIPGDVAEFQAGVRHAWDDAPKLVGDWIGTDVALPPAAIKLLRPNASLNRSYHNLITGEEVSILAVQCADARDMEGHYPPNCYPGNGWKLDSWAPQDFAGGVVKGISYNFSRETPVGSATQWVAGTFNLQGGVSARDMKQMRLRAREGGRRYYGVAQFQVVIAGAVDEARRTQIAEQFFKAYAPLLEAAGSPPLTPKDNNPTAFTDFKLYHAERTGS